MRRECWKRFPHRLQRKLLVSDPAMHHGIFVTHVPWCTSGSLTYDREEKCSRHSRRMRNPQNCVSGKRPMIWSFSDPTNLCFSKLPCQKALLARSRPLSRYNRLLLHLRDPWPTFHERTHLLTEMIHDRWLHKSSKSPASTKVPVIVVICIP